MNREEMLAVNDRETVDVDVWGGTIKVRSLTVGEQIDLEARLSVLREAKDVRGLTVVQLAAYISNDDGTPALTEEDAKGLLNRKPASIKKIVGAAQKLNGWTEEEAEEVRKNS